MDSTCANAVIIKHYSAICKTFCHGLNREAVVQVWSWFLLNLRTREHDKNAVVTDKSIDWRYDPQLHVTGLLERMSDRQRRVSTSSGTDGFSHGCGSLRTTENWTQGAHYWPQAPHRRRWRPIVADLSLTAGSNASALFRRMDWARAQSTGHSRVVASCGIRVHLERKPRVNPLTPTVVIWVQTTAVGLKLPVPDRAKPSFVSFEFFYMRALWRSALNVKVPWCQKLPMTA